MAEQTPDAADEQNTEAATSDETVGLPLLKTFIAAVAIVGLTTGAFWLLGDSDDDEIVIAGDADEVEEVDEQDDPEPDDAEEEEPEPEPEPEPDEADEPDGADPDEQEVEPEPEPEPEPAPDDEADNGDTEEADDEPADEDDATSEQDEPQDDAAEANDEPADPNGVDPASVSVQVLDAHQNDGGAAASQVASDIESAGYNVVAQNVGLRNEQTSVLYNPGHEAAAQQLAAELNVADVRPQPGSLSGQVNLHVVVGFGG